MTAIEKQMAEALRNIVSAIEQIPEDLEGHLWKLDRPVEQAQAALAQFDAQAAEQAGGGDAIRQLKEQQ